jgi:hypothetical protein
MHAEGVAPWRINLRTLGLLMLGFAQNVPLVGASDQLDQRSGWTHRAAVAAWFLWRFSGPTLFVGYALGILPLVLLGALALFACFGCIGALAASGREAYDEREARVFNAVFGGLAAVIAFVLAAGVLCGLMIAFGALISTSAIGVFSMRALVFLATMACGAVCLAGWVPREWKPSRLVRH